MSSLWPGTVLGALSDLVHFIQVTNPFHMLQLKKLKHSEFQNNVFWRMRTVTDLDYSLVVISISSITMLFCFSLTVDLT